MKFIRNKIVIGVLCIAIGIAVGFVLLPKSQESEIAMTKVVRLKQNVKAGTRLEAEMLETVNIPAASVPGGAASTPESFLSRYAVTQLFAGDILTGTKVRDTLVDPVAAGAAKGKQLVSITLPSLSAGVSGTLKPGDVVAVMVTRKAAQINQQLGIMPAQSTDTLGEDVQDEATGVSQTLQSSVQRESETTIPEELRYLEVCKVTASDGTDALVNGLKDPEQANRLPTTITFYATEAQALKLAEIEQDGKLHIAFLARGNDADVFIPRNERVLVEEELPEVITQPEITVQAEITEQPEPTAPTVTEPPATTSAPTQEVIPAEPTNQPEPTPIDLNNPEVGE